MLKLTDSVTKVSLIGPKYKNRLKKLGIETVEDLLYHIPFRYDDYSNIKKISELIYDEPATVIGQLTAIENVFTTHGKKLTKGILTDETGQILLIWFNQHFITKTLKAGSWVSVSGKMGEFDRRPAFVGPEYEKFPSYPSSDPAGSPEAAGESRSQTLSFSKGSRRAPLARTVKSIHTGRLVPIYPETRGISSKWLRSRINHLFDVSIHRNIEFLLAQVREEHQLTNLPKALKQAHFPQNKTEETEARKRLAFDELFLLQLSALKRRQEWGSHQPAVKLFIADHHFSTIKKFADSLPFKLTEAQKKAAKEILRDLTQNKPMNRLLEGDVGSGKTVVAALAVYAAVLNKTKVLYMAPTEVLAEQQYKTLKTYLDPLKVKTELLTGSKKPKEKAKWQIMVGTHALLFKRKFPRNLSLIIIDEQHRFGVEQRANLLKKTEGGGLPHLLTMTATPIPRTLALTLYGDLDLSYIDEMPLGRKEIKTFTVPKRKREDAYRWIEKQIKNGDQAFIICPLIEESEHETMKSVKAVTAEFEILQKEIFPNLSLGLLHGRLKPKEKNEIITDFRDKKYDILVSTPVVEVGIDIPNATIMMIETAERFGLASLHQLRGRVGRGEKQAYCLLFTESQGEKTRQRLKAMEKTNDGVKLAEMDLELRGPGEIYGVRQHGVLNLKVASLSDLDLIEKTRREAQKIIDEDSELRKHPKLKEKMERVVTVDVAPN